MKFKMLAIALAAVFGFASTEIESTFAQKKQSKGNFIVKTIQGKKSNVNVDVKKSGEGNSREIRIVVEGDVDQAEIQKLIAQAMEGTKKQVKLHKGKKVKTVQSVPRIIKMETKAGKGQEKRFVIGVETEELSGQARKVLGLKRDGGVLITRVLTDSPAQKAGLKKFDVIRKVGKHEVKTRLDLVKAVEMTGEKNGNVFVLRNTKPLNVQVKPTTKLIVSEGKNLKDLDIKLNSILGHKMKGLTSKIDKKANVIVEFLADKAVANKDGHKTIKLQDVEVIMDGFKKDLNNEVVELADVVFMESNSKKSSNGKKTHTYRWTSKVPKGKVKNEVFFSPSKTLVTGGSKGGNFRWVPKSSTESALEKINSNLSKMQKDMNRLADRIERLVKALEK